VLGLLTPLLVVSAPQAVEQATSTPRAAATVAATPAATQAIEINLPLMLNGRYLGDIAVTLQGDAVSFDGPRVVTLLRPELTAPVVDSLSARIVNGRLTPASATNASVTITYNPTEQEIDVTTPLAARAQKVIQIQGGGDIDRTPAIPPSNFSAFVNLALAYEYVWENPDPAQRGSQPLGGIFDIGGRVGGEKGVAFISRQSFDTDSAAPHAIERTQSELIYDDPDHLLRFTVGDLDYRGTSFQTLPRMAGISVERYFGLEPNFTYRPFAQDQFELDRSATVDVQVNGATVRELRLDPGRYDLRDLPLAQGGNNVQIVIRDDTGRVQTISSSQFFDFDLLGDGISDFSGAAGLRSNYENGAIVYTRQWAASGFYRRGLSAVLTAGADAQFDARGGTVGAGVIWASPIGIWRLQAEGSHRSSIGTGLAADIGYRAAGRLSRGKLQWSIDLDFQHFSNKFSTLDVVTPAAGVPLQPFSSTVSADFQITALRWSIVGDAQYNRGRGGQANTASALAGINYSLSQRLTVGGFGTYSRIGSQSDPGVLFQLTFRLNRNGFARATYDTSRGEETVDYNHSETTDVGNNSYEVDLRRDSQSDVGSIDGYLYHTGNRFEATLQDDVFATADLASDARGQSTRASIETSLVFADGHFGIGRPIQDSFAIVSPHPTLAGKEIRVAPTEEGYRARTDFLGPAVVPDLNAYGKTFLDYDVKDLPPGYDLGAGDFPVKPPLYSGYHLVVGSDATITMLATVVHDGQPVALVGGQLQSLDHPADPPVPAFTNRTGRLAASGLRPGRYKLELFTDPKFVTEVTIPDKESRLVNLGEIRIK
jgi:outer membrane usher protein